MARLYDRDASPVVTTANRERPPMLREAAHVSREAAETRVDMHPEVETRKWVNPTSLDAPPARNGFVQRWLSDGVSDTADAKAQAQWFRRVREGWQPRDPETVPPSLRALFPSIKTSDGQVMIRVAGLILCEMPQQVARQRFEAINDLVKRQTSAVLPSMQELRKEKRFEDVAGDIEVTDKTNTIRGRRPATMVD